MNQIAVTRAEILAVAKTCELFNRIVPKVGWSCTLAGQYLIIQLEKNRPWVTIRDLAFYGARARATEDELRKMRLRLPRFAQEALQEGLLIIKERAGDNGRPTQAIRIYEIESATEHDLDLARLDLEERRRRCEISGDEVEAIIEAIGRKPEEPGDLLLEG